MHDDELTPEQDDELVALLTAERPRPSAAFAERLDARVEDRFARPAAPRSAPARRPWRFTLLPAAATVAVALTALVLVLGDGGPGADPDQAATSSLAAPEQTGAPDAATPDAPPPAGGAIEDRAAAAPEVAAQAPAAGTDPATRDRKVERSASLELSSDPERVDDVAQDVLGVVARFDGIVDQSSIASGTTGGEARFALRIPAGELQPALAALSRLPDAQVLARTDDAVDVNQAYVSVRRQLANARAERVGVLRALRAADTEDETLRLRARLDALERTIALAERSQRALDRRVDYATVSVSVRGDSDQGSGTDEGGLTLGGAFDDAGRVLEVAAAVVVIAAAALVPLLALAACAWPLGRALTRRRREQALDAAV
ncbi:MAG TPA: DUF4349 domain-containing protein [Conexibacter sp.]|nr:DUF4349 domain-containing protein [Conexibacter sp.]